MFKVDRSGPNRLDIQFGGKIDSQEMKDALELLVENSKDIEHGRMLYRIGEFQLPTAGALAVEFSHLPSLFKFIRKFDRAAVLAEKSWIKKASEIEGALIPGLTIKAFDPGNEDEAERWLAS